MLEEFVELVSRLDIDIDYYDGKFYCWSEKSSQTGKFQISDKLAYMISDARKELGKI